MLPRWSLSNNAICAWLNGGASFSAAELSIAGKRIAQSATPNSIPPLLVITVASLPSFCQTPGVAASESPVRRYRTPRVAQRSHKRRRNNQPPTMFERRGNWQGRASEDDPMVHLVLTL